MAKPKFGEGDWFAVPLRNGGFAAGIVARTGDVLFGYFFGPARTSAPTLEELRDLKPDDSVLAGRFSDAGLKGGRWPILGRFDDWDREAWPMPPLIRYEELSGQSLRVTYADDDPGKLLTQEVIPPGVAEHGPTEGLMGDGFVELKLTRALN